MSPAPVILTPDAAADAYACLALLREAEAELDDALRHGDAYTACTRALDLIRRALGAPAPKKEAAA
jgi:hypothetical protein